MTPINDTRRSLSQQQENTRLGLEGRKGGEISSSSSQAGLMRMTMEGCYASVSSVQTKCRTAESRNEDFNWAKMV